MKEVTHMNSLRQDDIPNRSATTLRARLGLAQQQCSLGCADLIWISHRSELTTLQREYYATEPEDVS